MTQLAPLLLDPHGLPPPWSTSSDAPPALLCDRDGTIIENRDTYVLQPGHVKMLPGAAEALRQATTQGFVVVIVSNQSPVGRGLLTERSAVELHGQVLRELSAAGAVVAGSYLCPHAPQDGCGCRKPAPGMVLRALADFRLDPRRTCYVGDAIGDMRAARSGGVRGLMVRTGLGDRHAAQVAASPDLRDVRVVADLAAAVRLAIRSVPG